MELDDMLGIVWKCLKITENGQEGWKWQEIAGNYWKQLELPNVDGNGWKRLKNAENGLNSRIWLEIARHSSNQLDMPENGWK